jgi:hypothetical protein
MHDHTTAPAGLNGSGAGYRPAATPDDTVTTGSEAAPDGNDETVTDADGAESESSPGDAEAKPLGGRRRLALLLEEPAWRADLKRRVTTTTESLTKIAEDLGIDHRALCEYAKRVEWGRPKGAPATGQRLASDMSDAGMVRDRLLRVVDRQVGKIDAKLSRKDAEVDECDSRILGHLAKTLGVLMQTGEGGKTSKETEPPDRGDVEERLAERIKKWARGEQGY